MHNPFGKNGSIDFKRTKEGQKEFPPIPSHFFSSWLRNDSKNMHIFICKDDSEPKKKSCVQAQGQQYLSKKRRDGAGRQLHCHSILWWTERETPIVLKRVFCQAAKMKNMEKVKVEKLEEWRGHRGCWQGVGVLESVLKRYRKIRELNRKKASFLPITASTCTTREKWAFRQKNIGLVLFGEWKWPLWERQCEARFFLQRFPELGKCLLVYLRKHDKMSSARRVGSLRGLGLEEERLGGPCLSGMQFWVCLHGAPGKQEEEIKQLPPFDFFFICFHHTPLLSIFLRKIFSSPHKYSSSAAS